MVMQYKQKTFMRENNLQQLVFIMFSYSLDFVCACFLKSKVFNDAYQKEIKERKLEKVL